MKCKVKKIPKYNTGTINAGVLAKNNPLPGKPITFNPGVSTDNFAMKKVGSLNSVGEGTGGGFSLPSGTITSGNEFVKGMLNIDTNSTAGVMMDSTATGAEIGGQFLPGWGHLIGAGAGFLTGALQSGSVDENTGAISYGGIFGHSGSYLRQKQNMVKNSIRSKAQTQDLQADYYNDPNVSVNPNVLAAEGGIMRRPVDALVSKGELIYNPETKQLNKIPGSKGKPNKADDVAVKLHEGDVVVSNSPTMLMANGKTPAQNLENMVTIDKKKTNKLSEGTAKAREAIIKKVVNWQEANKTKPQEYAMYSNGEDHVDPFDDSRLDLMSDNDLALYVQAANKGDKSTMNFLLRKYNAPSTTQIADIGERHWLRGSLEQPSLSFADLSKINPASLKNEKLIKLTPEQVKQLGESAVYVNKNRSSLVDKLGKVDWLDRLSDIAPFAGALFGNYDYDSEQAYINPAKYIPTGVSIDPIRRTADESYAMSRYNQANINPNTGAGMAYGLQAASNRAKTIADAYKWQQDAQNKLIAQNVGIYNDWAAREAQARHIANTETQQNKAAARMMKDQAIKDAYEFTTGRRNDKWKLSMIEPMMRYAVDENIYKKFRI